MATVHQISCASCGFVMRFYDDFTRREYLFENGRRMKVCTQLAWCNTCNKAVDGERIPDTEEAEESIRSITSGAAEEETDVDRRTEDDIMLRESTFEEWRGKRESSPRCLACGSDKILFPDAHGVIRNACPKCGKDLSVACSGWATVELPNKKYTYSPEGLLLDVQSIDLASRSMDEMDELSERKKTHQSTGRWWSRFFSRRS